MTYFLGVGTASSKGVLVDPYETVVRSSAREHAVDRPHPGHVEMDGEIWWREFVSLAAELTDGVTVSAVGVSGMGPCVLLTSVSEKPLRPAILYGVDTRATEQIEALTTELGGADAIRQRCGSALSSQAVGPKLAWLARHEPATFAASKRLFMPASWLAYRLTGEYVLDYHSASQCTPLFDTHALDWYRPWSDLIAPDLELPPLRWPGDVAGTTQVPLAGIPAGTPVITGTIDAWTEAVSVGAQRPGDLMLMYGTTMFLIATVDRPVTSPSMWGTVGAFPGTRNLAGGMATSGAITGWLRDLTGASYEELIAEASGPGANGLLMLPYFAGERTPIMDPDARGVIAGLTLSHTRGDLYRAALEATAFGVRHNVDALSSANIEIKRTIAVGGGTRGGLWTRIVSDVTGLTQIVPRVTIGASYGAAFLAANVDHRRDIDDWNPAAETISPDISEKSFYDSLYASYRDLYPATRTIAHSLATRQRRTT